VSSHLGAQALTMSFSTALTTFISKAMETKKEAKKKSLSNLKKNKKQKLAHFSLSA
jgi:hypothetical protein